MGRREMREHIFKLLFLGEFNETEEMPEQIQLYFEGLSDLQPTEQAYMENKYTLVKEHLEEIDVLLNEKSAGWKKKGLQATKADSPTSISRCRLENIPENHRALQGL